MEHCIGVIEESIELLVDDYDNYRAALGDDCRMKLLAEIELLTRINKNLRRCLDD